MDEPRTLRTAIIQALDETVEVGIEFAYDEDREDLADRLHVALQQWMIEYVAVLLNGVSTHAHDGHAIIYTGFQNPAKISKEYWDEYKNEEGDFREEEDEKEDEEEAASDEIEE